MSDQPFHPHDPNASTKDVAVEETRSVGHDAKEGAKHVAQTAGAEAQAVVGEAKAQVTSLYDQVRSDVTGQARDQTQRAASGLHGLAGEFTQMADGNSEASGMAAGLARQAAERIDAAAGWLERREPADLLDEVRRYARRRPGTFLAACAAVGFLGGRLTRSLRDEATEGGQGQGAQALVPAGSVPPPAPMTFDDGGYGGRPTAVAGGTMGSAMPAGAGTTTAGPLGTAAGHPLPDTPVGTAAQLDRPVDDATLGFDEAPVVAGDGEDVWTAPEEAAMGDPLRGESDLGRDGLGAGEQDDRGGDRR
jgi:hypothetical protein